MGNYPVHSYDMCYPRENAIKSLFVKHPMRRPPNFSVLFFVSLLTNAYHIAEASTYEHCPPSRTSKCCQSSMDCIYVNSDFEVVPSDTPGAMNTGYIDETYGNMNCGANKKIKCEYSRYNYFWARCNYLCVDCPDGTHKPASSPKRVKCIEDPKCPAGKHGSATSDDDLNNNAVCEPCPNGYYQDEKGEAECKACNDDNGNSNDNYAWVRYSDQAGQIACKQCPSGKWHHKNFYSDGIATSAADCSYCPAGKYIQPYSSYFPWPFYRCNNCNGGQYQDVNDHQEGNCKVCEAGKYGGGQSCTDCAEGKYSAIEGSNNAGNCITCPRGYIHNSGDQSTCSECTEGKYQSSTGGTVCETCVQGKAAQAKDTACSSCQNGKYQHETAASEYNCKTCGSGKYAASANFQCSLCPHGYHQSLAINTDYSCKICLAPTVAPDMGKSSCDDCSGGKYQSEDGQRYCKTCDNGKFVLSATEQSCSECPRGYYQTPLNDYPATLEDICPACPSGYYQNEDGATSCDACDSNKNAPDEASVNCAHCPQGMFFTNQADSCKHCQEGKYQDSEPNMNNDCKTCPTGWISEIPSDDESYLPEKYYQYKFTGECYGGGDTYIYNGDGDNDGTPEEQVNRCAQACLVNKIQQGNENLGFVVGTPSGECHCETEPSTCSIYTHTTSKRYDYTGLPVTVSQALEKRTVICDQCPVGKKETNNMECERCQVGYYQNEVGSVSCKPCEPGTQQSLESKTSCSACEPGTFSNGTSPETPSVACKDCDPGYFQNNPGSHECNVCQNGRYSTLGKQLECQICGLGQFTPRSNQSCEHCIAGRFQNLDINDEYSCKICPQNTSQKWSGSSLCESCSSEEYTPGQGSSSCICITSKQEKAFGCSCDVPECSAGQIWTSEVCKTNTDTFYLLASKKMGYECRSTVLNVNDVKCAYLDKKTCSHVPPLNHMNVSLRCAWRPKALNEIETRAKCTESDACMGLLLRTEGAKFGLSEDSDDDGTSDYDDVFPNDPSEQIDTDGDGVGDNSDAFPNDPSEQHDTDGDDVGDRNDDFPEDDTRDSYADVYDGGIDRWDFNFAFEGQCNDVAYTLNEAWKQILVFDGINENTDGSRGDKAKRCADACIESNIDLGTAYLGFIVNQEGKCYCEEEDSSTCTKFVNYYNHLRYQRYDLIDYGDEKIYYDKKHDGDCSDSNEYWMGTLTDKNVCAQACRTRNTKGFHFNTDTKNCYCEMVDANNCYMFGGGTRYDFVETLPTPTANLSPTTPTGENSVDPTPQCAYVTPTFSNQKPCMCGDEKCDYTTGLRCDWSSLGKKQLGIVSSVCSMPDCNVEKQNHELCLCQSNSCPSGSRCTTFGTCVFDYWDIVTTNAVQTVEKFIEVNEYKPAKKTTEILYEKIISGSCEDHGYDYIWDEDTCRKAYNKTTGAVYETYGGSTSVGHNNGGPYGCFDGLWLNTHQLNLRPLSSNDASVTPCDVDVGCYCKHEYTTIERLYGEDISMADWNITETHIELRNYDISNQNEPCLTTAAYTNFLLTRKKPDICGVYGGQSTCLVCGIPFGDGFHNCPCLMKPDENQCSARTLGIMDRCGVCGGSNECENITKRVDIWGVDIAASNEKNTNTSCSGTCGKDLKSMYEEVYAGDDMIIKSNGIPNYEVRIKQKEDHIKLCEQRYSITIPKNPRRFFDNNGKARYTSATTGIMGIMKTGALLFPNIIHDFSTDICHGHISESCKYTIHSFSKNHACTHDRKWADCKHIGYMRDGFKIYSPCRKNIQNPYLKSCYVKREIEDKAVSYKFDDVYLFDDVPECDLDRANAYDFTGKGFVDADNQTMTGWAYIMSEMSTHVVPKYIGIPTTDIGSPYNGNISLNTNSKCRPVEGIEWMMKWAKKVEKKMHNDIHTCLAPPPKKTVKEFEAQCAMQWPCGSVKMWIYPANLPAMHLPFCTDKEPVQECTNGGAEPQCVDKCGIPHGDNDCECFGGLEPDACGVCGGDAEHVCRVVIQNQSITMNASSVLHHKTFKDITFGSSEDIDYRLTFDENLGVVDMSRGLDNSPNPCTVNNTCGECQGYCYSDDQCEGSLKCMRYGETEGYRRIAPGCIPSAEDSTSTMFWSMCYNESKANASHIERILTPQNHCDSHPCGECVGHCTSDADCEEGLQCFPRLSNEKVPGCIIGDKGDVSGLNFCFKQDSLVFYDSVIIDSTFKTHIIGFSFYGAQLNNVDFSGINIDYTDFRHATVDASAIFKASSFTHIDGSDTFMYKQGYPYDLKRKNLEGLDLSLALLTHAKLMRVEGKLLACPLQENLPPTYFCHKGYISGFRAWHAYSELWPQYVKSKNIDLHNKQWLPKYNKLGVDTTKLILVGNVPRSALFNPNIGVYDLSADTMYHRGTHSEFKSCEDAILPVGYRCFHGKFVVGPGIDMSGVDIEDMDLSGVDGTMTQWYGNDQKAKSCPSNMLSMRDSKALHNVYCIDGKMYGKGDMCGLSWAEDIFHSKDPVFISTYVPIVLAGNRLHWIFSQETKLGNRHEKPDVNLRTRQLMQLGTLAIADIANEADCKYTLDIPYRVCVSNSTLHVLLYLDEVISSQPEVESDHATMFMNALNTLKNGYFSFQNRPRGFILPTDFKLLRVQLKDFANGRKPDKVRSPGACIKHEGYEDINSYEECLGLNDLKRIRAMLRGGSTNDLLDNVSGPVHKPVAHEEIAHVRNIFNHYSDHRDAGFVAEVLRDSNHRLSGCYVSCIGEPWTPSGGANSPYGTKCTSDIFSRYDWSIPDPDSAFCEDTPYRCICKKIDDWSRSGIHVLGPGVSVKALHSLSYLDFDGISLRNVNAKGLPVEYSSFENVKSVDKFRNFVSLKGSRFSKGFRGIDLRSLRHFEIGRLTKVKTPKVICPIFGGSGGHCSLGANYSCVPNDTFDTEFEYAKKVCGRLTTFECISPHPLMLERVLISTASYKKPVRNSWDKTFEDWGHYIIRGESTLLLSGDVHSVQVTNNNEFHYKSVLQDKIIDTKEKCESVAQEINTKLEQTRNIILAISNAEDIITPEQILELPHAVEWNSESNFDILEYIPLNYEATRNERTALQNIFPMGFGDNTIEVSTDASLEFLKSMNVIDGVTWENGRCWVFSNVRGASSALSEDVWSKQYKHTPCQHGSACRYCTKTPHSFICDCANDQTGKNCDVAASDVHFHCTARHAIIGLEQVCNEYRTMKTCVDDARCFWSEIGTRSDKDYFKPKKIYCDTNVFIGADFDYSDENLKQSDFSVADPDTLKVHPDQGFGNILSCPKKMSKPWLCTNYDNKIHKDERIVQEGTDKSILGVESPLNVEWTPGETKCCRGFDFGGLDLGSVKTYQSKRNFKYSTWNGAFGDAGKFKEAELGDQYRVLAADNDDELYALVGPFVDLRNRDLSSVDLFRMNLSNATLDGVITGWDDRIGYVSGCPSALPEKWSCVDTSSNGASLTKYILVGPNVDLSNSILTGFNLSGTDLSGADLNRVNAPLAPGGCPQKLPPNWGCTNESILIGPGANLEMLSMSSLDTDPPWKGKVSVCPMSSPYTCVDGWFLGHNSSSIDVLHNLDITGISWKGTDLSGANLYMLRGQGQDCPVLDDTKYRCIDNYIVGKKQNLSEVNMAGWDLSGISLVGADLLNSHGVLSECPMPGIGYKCIENRIVGRGSNIDGMDFRDDDLSNVDFDIYTGLFDQNRDISFRGSFGTLASCFEQSKNPKGSLCIQQKIVGPEQDVSGLDLSDWHGLGFVDTSGMYGRVLKCPILNCYGRAIHSGELCKTYGIVCNVNSRVIVGPRVNLQKGKYSADIFSGDVWHHANIEGVNLTGFDLSLTTMNGVSGKVAQCPSQLADGYVCRSNYILPTKSILDDDHPYPLISDEYAVGWGLGNLSVSPDDIDVSGLLLSHLALPNVSLDNTIWHNVRVVHNISSMRHVSGTTDSDCKSNQLPEEIRCVESEDNLRVIVRQGVNLNDKSLKNDVWYEDFSGLQTSGGTWTNIRFNGVNLKGSDLSAVTFINVWGRVLEDGAYMHAAKYPENCIKMNAYVFCGSIDTRVTFDVDFQGITIRNGTKFPQIMFIGRVENFNVSGIDLSEVHFEGSMSNIIGHPLFCPKSVPSGWACTGYPLVFIGPYQNTGPIEMKSNAEQTAIDMTGVNITGWTFDDYYSTRSYLRSLPWTGMGIVGTPENFPKHYVVHNGQWVGPFSKHNGSLDLDMIGEAHLYQADFTNATIYQSGNEPVKLQGVPAALPEGVIKINSGAGTYLAGRNLTFDAEKLGLYWNAVHSGTDPNMGASTEMSNTLYGIGGPLQSCVIQPPDEPLRWNPLKDYTCVLDGNLNKWVVGPGILWDGFEGTGANLDNITLSMPGEVQDMPVFLESCPDSLPRNYSCLQTIRKNYVILGPYLDALATAFIVNEDTTLYLSGSYVDGTYWSGNARIDVDFDSVTTWMGVVIQPSITLKKMNTTECPFRFKPRICDTDVITCGVQGLDENDIVFDGYVWPENKALVDRRLCVRNMDLSRANDNGTLRIHFLNGEIEGTTLPDNSSGISFVGSPYGVVTQCPSMMHRGLYCISIQRDGISEYIILHSKTVIENSNVSGANLSQVSFSKNSYWSNVTGILNGCPKDMPVGWKCIQNVLFGRNINFRNLDRNFDFQNIPLDGLDLGGSVFSKKQVLRNFGGNLAKCPSVLPDQYHCYERETLCKENCFFILGPYVNIQDVNMRHSRVGFRSSLGLQGVHGAASACPDIEPLFRDAGYACSTRTQMHIVGPSVDLTGINLGLLTEQLSVIHEGRISLTFAMYNDHYLIDDIGTDNVCKQFEQAIGNGMCAECQNNFVDEND